MDGEIFVGLLMLVCVLFCLLMLELFWVDVMMCFLMIWCICFDMGLLV